MANPIQLFDPVSSTYTYFIVCEATREAVIVDPVDAQLERDLATISEASLKVVYAIETHAHADHITSAGLLAEHIGARTAAPSGCGIRTAAIQLRDGDELRFGQETLRALHTPGHTSGSMCFLWRDHIFTGAIWHVWHVLSRRCNGTERGIPVLRDPPNEAAE